jgi:hypothetical protein
MIDADGGKDFVALQKTPGNSRVFRIYYSPQLPKNVGCPKPWPRQRRAREMLEAHLKARAQRLATLLLVSIDRMKSDSSVWREGKR